MKSQFSTIGSLGFGLLLVSNICFANANIQRADILDTNGKILATNQQGFSVYLPKGLSKLELRQYVRSIEDVFDNLDINWINQVYKILNIEKNPEEYIKIIEFASKKDIVENGNINLLPNDVKLVPEIKRLYPYETLAAHTIGIVREKNDNYVGINGVEEKYNDLLEYHNLSLTIDSDVQKIASEEFGLNNGAAVVMDVKDGALIVSNNSPSYNLNNFMYKKKRVLMFLFHRKNPYMPFKNKVTSSICKKSNSIHYDNNITTSCFDKNNDMHYTYKSNDVFMNFVGKDFFFLSPIQIAKQTASISSGRIVTPYVVKNMGLHSVTPINTMKFSSIKKVMEKNGENIKLKNPTIKVATKLMKLEIDKVKDKDANSIYKINSSFPNYILTSYAPADNPKYAVTIFLEHESNSSKIDKIATTIYNKLIDAKYIGE